MRPAVSLGLAGTAILAVIAGLVLLSLPKSATGPRLTSGPTAQTGVNGRGGAGQGRAGRGGAGASRRAPGHTAPKLHPGAGPLPYTAPGHSAPSGTAGLPAAVLSAPAQNLPAPAGFGPALRQAWVAAQSARSGLTGADVQSTAPGSVFYAAQPSTGYDWAISRFLPSAAAEAESGTAAGRALLAQFADFAAFRKAPGRGWAYAASFTPGTCSPSLPAPVLTAWGMCSVGS